MPDRSYKLKLPLVGLLSLPTGGTMEVTIPYGSIVNVLGDAADGPERTLVRCGDCAPTVLRRELLRCGTLVEGAAA